MIKNIFTGKPLAVRHEHGTIVEHNEYYPYGGLINASNSQLQPYKYSSKELDRENGLDLYDSQARWYEPMLPCTTTQDPLAEKYYSLSPYTWCAGNPVKFTDNNGDSIAVLTAPRGALGFGHMAVLIQNKNNKWVLFSKNGTNDSSGIKGSNNVGDDRDGKPYNSVSEFLNGNENPIVDKKTGMRGYTEAYVIPSTTEEDKQARLGALEELNKDYNLLG